MPKSDGSEKMGITTPLVRTDLPPFMIGSVRPSHTG